MLIVTCFSHLENKKYFLLQIQKKKILSMIKKIINLIKKKNIVSNSYSIHTLHKETDFLIKKLFEELFELLICFNKYNINKSCFNRYFLIKEICDVLYHLLLFIIYNNFSFLEIEKEFLRRSRISGAKEKIFR